MGNHYSANIMLSTTLQWQNFSTTDNYYLASVVNFGMAYIVLIIVWLIDVIKTFNKQNANSVYLCCEVILASLVYFFFVEPFNYYPCALLYFFFMGAYIVCKKSKDDSNSIVRGHL